MIPSSPLSSLSFITLWTPHHPNIDDNEEILDVVEDACHLAGVHP